MVEPIRVVGHVRRDLHLHFACARIAALENTVLATLSRACAPDHVTRDHQVLRRLVAARWMLTHPQLLSCGQVIAGHVSLATREEHHVFVNQHTRTKVSRNHGSTCRRLRGPDLIARGAIQRHQLGSVMEDHARVVHAQRQRSDDLIVLPLGLARFGIDQHQSAWLLIPEKAVVCPPLIGAFLDLVILALVFLSLARLHQHLFTLDQDFFDKLGLGILADQFPSLGIQAGHMGGAGERDIQLVIHRHDTARELCGSAFQRPQVILPIGDVLGPQDHAIVAITRDQLPVGGQHDGNA